MLHELVLMNQIVTVFVFVFVCVNMHPEISLRQKLNAAFALHGYKRKTFLNAILNTKQASN